MADQKEELKQPISTEQYKRHIAFKYRIGNLLTGKPILENDRLRFLEINNKNIIRVNIIANIVDKFLQEGEKKYGSITLDDATGQIRVKAFGDDLSKFSPFNQGDTVLLIGLVKHWKDEIYISPEIIKKKDPSFLLIRKLEIESEEPKSLDKEKLLQLKDKILEMVKNSESTNGIEVEKMILELKEHPDIINQEIKRLLEDGMVYEPRPGKLRYLG
ncbi:MAG: OB-fold nucleic acid binding domain-containing protein [Nanoarchaeota archaeon]|nr:OB-fold nucleic acid binding domain-containing protein [Nanoarchaeota archaeon]